MRRKGYYRLLLSYIPIFFLVVLILVATFFLAISELTRKQTEEANRLVTGQVVQTLEQSLSSIAYSLKKEGENNTELQSFFRSSQEPSTFEKFGLWKQLEALKSTMPLLDSIYMVRFKDGTVLNEDRVTALSGFGDQEFIKRVEGLPTTLSWYDPRMYTDLQRMDGSKKVISLVTPYPFFNGAEGVIVSNIKIEDLYRIIEPFESNRLSYISVADRYGHPLFDHGVKASGKEVTVLKSAYTGWTFTGGIRSDSLFGVISTMSRIYFLLGFLAVVLGVVMLTITSQRNYKPIELILNRIQTYTNKKKGELLSGKGVDDYQFIDSAFENLVEVANSFEAKYGENLIYRKKVLLLRLMEGEQTLSREEWEEEMEKLGLPGEYRELAVGVVEVDQYSAFTSAYTNRDQVLLKYVIASVFQELAQEAKLRVMAEWLSPDRLSLLFLSDAGSTVEAEALYAAVCRKAVDWVRKNLSHTITVGLSPVSLRMEELAVLRQNGEKALQLKITYGGNRLITYREVPEDKGGDLSRPLQLIRPLVQALRKGEEWEGPLTQLFEAVRSGFLSKEDLNGLFRFLLFNLSQEMSTQSQEMQQYWQATAAPRLDKALETSESLEELESAWTEELTEIMGQVSAFRKRKVNSLLIHKVKQYLQVHYANPDLSLNHLSDEFQYSTAYLSTMFKEEFGEKFVDYLVRIRMEQAQQLLLETDDPIQDIALRVGYNHSISFIRMFKKWSGMTPGDYRKQKLVDKVRT
ncbi:helix-turn-helix domain-containing protein [Gorillibacterium sp. sgz5001074]|uniref:helix-turn-helix domain-containing protein n=1 Tax=Gorillibacterium sp. sgz5001074 TaxID=3446695 RepID=UPI003F669DB3